MQGCFALTQMLLVNSTRGTSPHGNYTLIYIL
jgi:hypothetical protein